MTGGEGSSQLGAVSDTELSEDVREVSLDRPVGEEERGRDLPIRLTLGDEGRDAPLADLGAAHDPDGERIVSVGYLALAPNAEKTASRAGAEWSPWTRFFPWEDWRRGRPTAVIDELLAPALTEPNPDTVRKEVADAMHEFIDVQAVGIPLAGIYRIYGLSKKVQGFVPYPAFLHQRWDTVSVTS